MKTCFYDLEIFSSIGNINKETGFEFSFDKPEELGIGVCCTYTKADGMQDWLRHETSWLLDYLESCDLVVGFNNWKFDNGVIQGSLRKDDQRVVNEVLAGKVVDMMLDFVDEKGHRVKLDSVADGLGIEGKTQGFDPAAAPAMWRRRQRVEVIAYCRQDVVLTRQIFSKVYKSGEIAWAHRGKVSKAPLSWKTRTADGMALKLVEEMMDND